MYFSNYIMISIKSSLLYLHLKYYSQISPLFLQPSIRNNAPPPEKKRDLGHFENRRGTKLAPVKLNTLKMPVPSPAQKPSSTMSFMPKGSSLTRNIRRTNEDSDLSRSQFSAKPQIVSCIL